MDVLATPRKRPKFSKRRAARAVAHMHTHSHTVQHAHRKFGHESNNVAPQCISSTSQGFNNVAHSLSAAQKSSWQLQHPPPSQYVKAVL